MDAVTAAINNADFVLGVFSEEPANVNVALEVGYALGRGVPVILLSAGAFSLPFNLASVRHLKTDLRDSRLLTFQIDLLLRSLEPPKRTKRSTPSQPQSSSSEQLTLPSLLREFANQRF